MESKSFFIDSEEKISKHDLRNGMFMKELLGDEEYEINILPSVSDLEVDKRCKATFKLYGGNVSEILGTKKIKYMFLGSAPYMFDTQIYVEDGEVLPLIFHPDEFDKASYVFLGHELNHALKDFNSSKVLVEDSVYDVIPFFYELMCAESEENEKVKKEIYKRRIDLLQDEGFIKSISYYYALALFEKYKGRDEILVLRLISRVLNGEITTYDLLNMLGIYNTDLDYIVSRELETIKQYILS